MRSIEDAIGRWKTLEENYPTPDKLKEKITDLGGDSPSVTTFRSVCWKAFLPFSQSEDYPHWTSAHEGSRAIYTKLKEHVTRLIKHPDEIESADPLDDTPDSPWIILRNDEALRGEIRQDVERCLQENEWFRRDSTKDTMTDILFVYCKANPVPGYRQGMHELLAPLFWTVCADSVDLEASETQQLNSRQASTLSSGYIEHDSYLLFSSLMQILTSSYNQSISVNNGAKNDVHATSIAEESPIVERSRHIHENLLHRIDTELATHLTTIDILPQIFLIRWIRLLFGREFAFDDTLVLWDVLFAQSLTNDLVDLVCVAMLLRIRWDLLSSDYSGALAMLLHYPRESAGISPVTFIEDAIYLSDHINAEGGQFIVSKRTGRSIEKELLPSVDDTANLHNPQRDNSRRRAYGRKSFTSSPNKGIDVLFQDAARGMLQQGEKWGLNKAVREAVGEVRRNVQNLQLPPPGSPSPSRNGMSSRWSLDQNRIIRDESAKELKFLRKRNSQLAKMLESASSELRAICQDSEHEADTDTEKSKTNDSLRLAVANIDLVKVYLEDSKMELSQPLDKVQAAPTVHDNVFDDVSEPKPKPKEESESPKVRSSATTQSKPDEKQSQPSEQPKTPPTSRPSTPSKSSTTASILDTPSRSSLAKSSFAWMLGDDDKLGHGLASPGQVDKSFSPPSKSARRNHGNGRSGFLFGDPVVDESEEAESKKPGEDIEMGPR